MRDYIKIANTYAKKVTTGKIVACEYVRQACGRYLDDLKRKDWQYTLDKNKAIKACKFVELLPHIKGELARDKKLITLEPWQVFIIVNLFGWVDKKTELRRFKLAYIAVPRKNGKSTFASGIALYMLVADGEAGAEVYSTATTKDQARIVFDDSKRMVERCEGLRNHTGVKTSAHSIYVEHNASVFKALARDQGGNLDGLNVHFAVNDELHAHKTREVYDVIETGTGARSQPLILNITTAGFNKAGICYEVQSYIAKILSGAVTDDTAFGVIFTIDKDDDWTDPSVWEKANPNWGVSVKPDDIARLCKKAMEMPSAQNNFLTKRLNVWVNAAVAWLNMHRWAEQKTDKTLEDFKGCKAWVSLDLASKTDLAVIGVMIEKDDNKYCFAKCYVPEETAENNPNSQYSGWIRMGHLIATDGNVIDYDTIEMDLREFCDEYDVQQIAFDPWQAQSMMQSLNKDGYNVVEYPMRTSTISEPMKEFEAGILKGTIFHEDNPCLDWQMSNVVAKEDANENIYPRKEFPENKIDAAVALIMCQGLTMQEDTIDVDDYLGNIVIA
ncbi:MAG: terminase large subunit [Gammaproteobacteria bacterium]|nr:terminase large subunit [Gammaproteobacteria bacterium]